MLTIGLNGTAQLVVTDPVTAKSVGSGTLDVLATPMMLAQMEKASWTCVAPHLAVGEGTVGTLLNVKHINPTPLGMEITCRAELTEIDGRRLVFWVTASDQRGLVGEGVHERFIVQEETFMKKANARSEVSESSERN